MNSNSNKSIILADADLESTAQLDRLLRNAGFSHILTAANDQALYDFIKRYHAQPEQLALIIVNEARQPSPFRRLQPLINLICDELGVPVIVVHDTHQTTPLQAAQTLALVRFLQAPLQANEFSITQELLTQLRDERRQRMQQQERLLNDLASKNLAESQLRFLVAHDELTGLLNRTGFEQQLRLEINRHQIYRQSSCLLILNIDRFGLINALAGFDQGDQLLVALSQTIRKFLPAGSVLARLGDDHFCAFMPNKSAQQAKIFAETLKSHIGNQRFFLNNQQYAITVSIGIASSDNGLQPYRHPAAWISHAQEACATAKRRGRNHITQYCSSDLGSEQIRQDTLWLPRIQHALQNQRLFLTFKPVAYLNSGLIAHHQILLHLYNEQNQSVAADQFLPSARRLDLICALELWSIEQALQFLSEPGTHGQSSDLAVTVSAATLLSGEFSELVRNRPTFSRTQLNRLIFELSESDLIAHYDELHEVIHRLLSYGCKFAIDDYSGNLSSFAYLQSFPAEYLKIDAQLIKRATLENGGTTLIKSIIDVADKLGKQTLAKRVESDNLAHRLKTLGIDLAQGKAIGSPQRHLLKRRRMNIRPWHIHWPQNRPVNAD
jgi:diguanylate cyclase (GGDEF)-like protein